MTETDSKSSYTVEKGNWETGHFPKVGLFTLYTRVNAWTVERCLCPYSPGHWSALRSDKVYGVLRASLFIAHLVHISERERSVKGHQFVGIFFKVSRAPLEPTFGPL